MDTQLTFTVDGQPVPQGSMIAVARNHVRHANGTALAAWRAEIIVAARNAMRDLGTLDGPIAVDLRFTLRAPKIRKRSMPITRPDLDKMVRAVFDAMTDACVWRDDAQVIAVHAQKQYATGDARPGVGVTVVYAAAAQGWGREAVRTADVRRFAQRQAAARQTTERDSE